ncbi:MAG: PocR ligand-binding domain-containing protein [Chloroflexi bacterium]|nr:PocR ligand-binding domain-containing protein [Chloroflexota bacterium]
MNDLLTVHDLQDLLRVDRMTVYRMIKDGRLPAFKVGGQWRFSQPEITGWLQEQRASLEMAEVAPATDESQQAPHVLPLSCVQAMQSIYAEALDVAAVTTDPDGNPLTEISNSRGFCNRVLSTAKGRGRCALAWRPPNGYAQYPPIRTCHAGLLCVSAPIRVDGQWIANVAGCQFVAQGTDWSAGVPALAADLDLSESELRAAAIEVRALSADQLARVPRLLQQVADTFAEIGQERAKFLNRLQRIAEITNV